MPKPSPVIEIFRPADRNSCLAIFDSNAPRFFEPKERPHFEAFLDGSPSPFWVARAEATGVAIGCGGVTIAEGGTTVWLRWGMVHASHHRKGIGRRLLQERLRWIAGQPGIELIRVATTKPVAGFYECNGFMTFSVEADYYGTRLDRCDLVLHRAQLADFA